MNIEDFRTYCLSKAASSECLPFDDVTLVFKVGADEKHKMFGLLNIDRAPYSANLKCDPEKSVELRERYQGIVPGYHMNKKHWNTISLEDDVPDSLIKELVDHSYNLVYKSLTKVTRDIIDQM